MFQWPSPSALILDDLIYVGIKFVRKGVECIFAIVLC